MKRWSSLILILSGCAGIPDEEHVVIRPEPIIVKELVPVPCDESISVPPPPEYPGTLSSLESKVVWLEKMTLHYKISALNISEKAVLCGVKLNAN